MTQSLYSVLVTKTREQIIDHWMEDQIELCRSRTTVAILLTEADNLRAVIQRAQRTLADVHRNDDGSCPHGNRYDVCPTCTPPQWQDNAP